MMNPFKMAAKANEMRFQELCAMGSGLIPANMMQRLGNDVARANEILNTVAATMVMPITAPNSQVLRRTGFDWNTAGMTLMQNTGDAGARVNMFQQLLAQAQAEEAAASKVEEDAPATT